MSRPRTVNLATEVATVAFDPAAAALPDLAAAVGKAGYTAAPREDLGTPATQAPDGDSARARRRGKGAAGRATGKAAGKDAAKDAEIGTLKRQWQVSLTAGLSMMVLMYLPLPVDVMDWLMPLLLVVATVIQVWAGRTFYSAAWARPGTAR